MTTPYIICKEGACLEYFIAIDGGGTKTETVLFDETGHILYRDITTGCNVLDLGVQAAGELLMGVIEKAREYAPGEITAVFGGIAGNCHCHDALYEYLRPRLSCKLQICDDTYSVISSVLGHGDGCGLVGGTGSSLFVRAKDHPCTHIGGWGYLIDTGGSGYNLGCDAIYAALRAVDGRGEETVLNDLLRRDLDGTPIEHAIQAIYAGGRPYIASFAHTVFEGRRMGDAVCCRIFEKEVHCLAELVHAATRYYEGEFPVVLGGGLFSAYPEYVDALREASPAQAKLLTTDMPVVYGAAVEALRVGGRALTEEFRAAFFRDYEVLCA